MTFSPLRYPGGKNRLAPFIAQLCISNGIIEHYIEPYSGGASVALFLLFEGFVKKITINDKDRSIYAFWYSVLNNTDELCELIKNTPITIDEWKKQKEVQRHFETANFLELGFSTFFLNRTNISGIIKAGVIGGYNQNGNYKIDCRYNKGNLINRICNIAAKREQIELYNDDALFLIDRIQKDDNNLENTLLYFDPPYYEKGSTLYLNYYKKNNHQIVCEKIKNINNIKWMVSYDNVPEIRNLYFDCQTIEYTISHMAATSKKGKEVLFFSPDINLDINKNPLQYKIIKKGSRKKIIYVND